MAVVDFARLPDGLKATAQDVAFVQGGDYLLAHGQPPASLDLDQKSPLIAAELVKQHSGVRVMNSAVLPVKPDEFATKARSLLGYMLAQNITSITMPSVEAFSDKVHPASLVAKAAKAALG